jgi:hypothetical protein
MARKKRLPKVEGIVIPSNWDDNGNIKAVSLVTADEGEYRVDYGGVGRELLEHIHSKVKATGKIRERLDGRLYISVCSFLPVEEQPELGVAEIEDQIK